MKLTTQEDVAEVKEKVPAMLKVKKQSGSSKYSQVPQSYQYQYSHLCTALHRTVCRDPLGPCAHLSPHFSHPQSCHYNKRKYILVAGSQYHCPIRVSRVQVEAEFKFFILILAPNPSHFI